MSCLFSKTFDFLTFFLLHPLEMSKFRQQSFEKFVNCFVISLNLVYCWFSLILAFCTFETIDEIQLNMGTSLQFVQTVFPSLICFYLAIDVISARNVKLLLKLERNLVRETKNFHKFKLFVCFLILLAVRLTKLLIGPFITNVIYALCTMIPELVASMNDFAFAFYVDNLTTRIRDFNKCLKTKTMKLKEVKEVEEALIDFHQTSCDIGKVYSSRLFLTLSFNFIQLVISLYWIFIRIAFDHLHGTEGFATFLYVIQPVLCFFVVFNSAQNCLNEVSVFILLLIVLINEF